MDTPPTALAALPPQSTVPSEASSMQSRLDALLSLQSIARELTAELDLDRLLHKILRAAVTVMSCNAGSLLLFDAASSELVFEVVEGGGGENLEKTRINSVQGIAGAAFTQRQPIIVEDPSRDDRYFGAVADNFGLRIKNLMAVPLIAKGEAIGVLEVMNKASSESFNHGDQDLLLAFASQSAIAIENARLYRDLVDERDRILAVEAGVRHELARDLHDGPAQMISAIIMSTRFLRELAERAPERTEDELLRLEALAQKALYQVRNLLFDLRPVVLETQGLKPALEAYVERLRMVEPFSLELDAGSVNTRFSANVESAIFSIVQEAVNNAKRHAAPHRVWIHAKQRDGVLTISVRDDGRGFNVLHAQASSTERNSLGLLNMRERAEIARGRLEIDSHPGRGTTVTLTVPL